MLIVEDNAASRTLLREFVQEVGHQPLEAAGPAEGLAALEREPGIAVLLTDVRMPHPADGVAFIRTVRARWPELPLVAVTGYPQELAELHGTPECPLLILPKPLRIRQVEEVLRLALRAASRAPFETRPGSVAPPAPGEPPPS